MSDSDLSTERTEPPARGESKKNARATSVGDNDVTPTRRTSKAAPQSGSKQYILPPNLVGAFRHLLEVPVSLFVNVHKVNKKGKRQNRLLIVTGNHLYSCVENGSIKRCVDINSISAIHVHRNPNQLAFKIPQEYDMLVEIDSPQRMNEIVETIKEMHRQEHPGQPDTLAVVNVEGAMSHAALVLEKPKNYEHKVAAKISWVDSRRGTVFDGAPEGTAVGSDGLIVTQRAAALSRSNARTTNATNTNESADLDAASEDMRSTLPTARRRGDKRGQKGAEKVAKVTAPDEGENGWTDANAEPTTCADGNGKDAQQIAETSENNDNSNAAASGQNGTQAAEAELAAVDGAAAITAGAAQSSSTPVNGAAGSSAPVKNPDAYWNESFARKEVSKVEDMLQEATQTLEEERQRRAEERDLWELLLAAEKQNSAALRHCIDELRAEVDRLSMQNMSLRHSFIDAHH